jgi:hypothetical protein
MVVPPFGWSAGDVVLPIKLLYRVSKAFRDAEGAQKQYAEVSAWIESFAGVLDWIRDFIADSPRSACVAGILKILENIDLAYAKFENYLNKYQVFHESLSSNLAHDFDSTRRNARTIIWALREMNGRVDTLKASVTGLLADVNILMLVQVVSLCRYPRTSEYFVAVELMVTASRTFRKAICEKLRLFSSLP